MTYIKQNHTFPHPVKIIKPGEPDKIHIPPAVSPELSPTKRMRRRGKKKSDV